MALTWAALFVCVFSFGFARRPPVDPHGTFTFFYAEVTGYTRVKENGGGYEFSIVTNVASIDSIRESIEEKADPTWSTEGWKAGENNP